MEFGWNNYKNVIFDLGGVIVDLCVKPAVEAFARLGLVQEDLDVEALSQGRVPRNWAMIDLMHAMDRGEMSGEEFVKILHGKCREGVTDQKIVDAFNQVILLRPFRLRQIQELRKTHKTFLLSNLGDIHWQETLRQSTAAGIRFEDCFDDLFLSYRLKMAKPDPRIFAYVIEKTGINPAETLYIDDLTDNIETGRKAGLVGLQIACNGWKD